MQYFDALFPSAAMAIIFTAVMVTIVRNQGGANKAKEDAAVDAGIAARERQAASAASSAPSSAAAPRD